MYSRFIRQKPEELETAEGWVALPNPARDSPTSIENTLLTRRSVRDYQENPLTMKDISQLLWAAQGITHPAGLRTAASAGALYPLEVYLAAGNVEGLSPGIYHYRPAEHAIRQTIQGDLRKELGQAALNQEAVSKAAAVVAITAIYERTTVKYGLRGNQYVHMEVGISAQNISLQAISLDLGTVFIGAFHDHEVKKLLHLQSKEQPLCLMPVGRKQV